MTPAVVLVGPPGAGKTTVGQLLAVRRGLSFRDTDRDVELAAGMTISELFVDKGEAAFREMERAAVQAALESHDGVLALGGGAVLSAETRERLAGHFVVFLDVGVAAAAERVGFNRSRPLLAINPRAELTRLMAERRTLYEQVASLVVATDSRTADDVADEVEQSMVGV